MMVGATDYWLFILYAVIAIGMVAALRVMGNRQDKKDFEDAKNKEAKKWNQNRN